MRRTPLPTTLTDPTRTTRRARRALLAVCAIGTVSLAACGDAPTAGDESPSTTTAGTSSDTTVFGGLPCAAADGSSPKASQFAAYPPECIEEGVGYRAVIETNRGTLHIDLRADIAPITVNSFVNLARYHYFDDTTCHRAIKNFVVQCGDPTGSGGGNPGYMFPDELAGFDGYRIGSVAMANAGPNTNGSQFFIITGDDGAMLPPNYTLFGQVADDDLAVVAELDALANPQDGPPLEPIDIISVTIEER